MTGLGLPKTAIDDLQVEQRRHMLLDLALVDEPTLSMIGGEPANSQVFVLDTVFDVAAGTEDDALKAYARSNSLEVSEPIQVSSESRTDDCHWEVHMSTYGSAAIVLASGQSCEEVLARMRQALRDLCGDRVVDIKSWAAVQNAGTLEELFLTHVSTPVKKLSPFVVWERVELAPLPLAKEIARQLADLSPRKLRRKISYEMLKEPQGLGSKSSGSLISDWNIPILHDEGVRYANHHDLLSALRLGLDIDSILPWPCDVAHRFLLIEELRRVMRARGYVEITDFDPNAMIHLRVSLPEFSAEITGESEKPHKPHKQQEKPAWPPESLEKQRVVIVLDRARLAFEEEPEWETVSIRQTFSITGHLWVEIKGPTEKKKSLVRKPKSTGRPARDAKIQSTFGSPHDGLSMVVNTALVSAAKKKPGKAGARANP